MRFAVYLGLIAAAFAGPANPQDAGDSVRLYAVHVVRTQGKPLTAYGVYLGHGIVITAAHVVGAVATKPQVEIAGEHLPTKVIKQGDLNGVDLSLLSVNERRVPGSLASRRMPLCQYPHGTGELVFVATPEGVARSYIMPPSLLPPGLPAKFRTAIRYVAQTGNSGAGVFDANKKCLLGIISRKISGFRIRQTNGQKVKEPVDIAKYFVPVSEIAKFIPPDVRF